jgi:hypothetical protein
MDRNWMADGEGGTVLKTSAAQYCGQGDKNIPPIGY